MELHLGLDRRIARIAARSDFGDALQADPPRDLVAFFRCEIEIDLHRRVEHTIVERQPTLGSARHDLEVPREMTNRAHAAHLTADLEPAEEIARRKRMPAAALREGDAYATRDDLRLRI